VLSEFIVGLKDCYFTFTVVDQGLRRSRRMQGLDPEVQEPQHNSSNEGMVKEQTSETESVAPGSGQHTEEPVTTFVEGVVPYTNPPLTDPLGPLLVEQPSTRFLDAYSSYHLPTSSSNRLSSDYTDGIWIPPMDPEIATLAQITTVGASSLLGTSMTQVTLTQPLASTSLSAHGSGNIPCFTNPTYAHTKCFTWSSHRSDGQQSNCSYNHNYTSYSTYISNFTNGEFFYTLHWRSIFSWRETFCWGETLNYEENSYVGETTTNLGESAHAGPSIPTTTGLYPGQPYPGVANPLWGQPNPTGAFLSKELFPINL
jgi:hypothetical protein